MATDSPDSRLVAFGPNEWLVDEIYEQFLADRSSVDPAWWDFFADYVPTEHAGADLVAAAVRDAVKEETYLKSISLLGAAPVGNTPAEFAARVREDGERFGDLVRRFPIQ